jgi:hypothetical protein
VSDVLRRRLEATAAADQAGDLGADGVRPGRTRNAARSAGRAIGAR